MSIDGSHWYAQDGSPFYTTLDAKGKERGVTLRDARKINAVPSVTTFLSVIAKPQLENWKVQQGILAALTISRIKGESDEVFIARILHDSKEEAKKAADNGTEGHDALECATKGLAYPEELSATVERVRALLVETFPDVHDWIAEKSFCHKEGFGGKVDLHSPSTGIVVDYKGIEGEAWSDDKHAYKKQLINLEYVDRRCDYDQHWQLAAYQKGLELPLAPCANIFFSRTHPGSACIHVWTPEEIADGLEISMAALALWKKIRKYDPSL